MAHRVTVTPVRMHAFDERLRCEALSIVGYRAVCSCGYRSPVRKTVRLARVEGATHRPIEV